MSPLQREPEILQTKTCSVLHMYGLFPDTNSGSGYMALNGRIIIKQWSAKDINSTVCGLIRGTVQASAIQNLSHYSKDLD
jgi:hypothetical protein